MYPIVVSGDSILGAKVSGFDFWRFILGAKVSVLISGDFHLERLFIWVSEEYEKHGDASWCVE